MLFCTQVAIVQVCGKFEYSGTRVKADLACYLSICFACCQLLVKAKEGTVNNLSLSYLVTARHTCLFDAATSFLTFV